MRDRSGPLAVLGATGYTGGLVCEEARRLGLPLRLVGRRREALEERASDGEEVAVADARDERALREAFDGAFAVASCAGPFLALGTAPVAAALAVGAHYVDTSGEQPFARLVHERFGEAAERRGVAVLTSFGFDYVPGDLAARLAAEELEPLEEVAIGYAVKGFSASRGTLRTVAHVTEQEQVAYVDGRLVPSRFGATARRIRFPFGEKTVVEWGATEPLTVPRHTRVGEVRSYVLAPAPRVVRRVGRFVRRAAPVLRVVARFAPAGPSPARRSKMRFAVVAEARGAAGARRATLTGSDPYGLTARLVARGAEALRAGEVARAGVLAPAEAFDVRSFVERLAPLLAIDSLAAFEPGSGGGA